VNVAARVQSITPPGAICITRDVFTNIRSRVPVTCTPLGARAFKGISEAIEVFQIATPLVPEVSDPIGLPTAAHVVEEAISIAVLPFANWSTEEESDYFSDGITEDLITDLSSIAGLRVCSRNSVFAYKGKTPNLQRVGTELGVRYLVEGSVRRSGKRLRITAQLIDASNSFHLWAKRFDRDLADIFEIQDEISRHIASDLKITLTREQEQIIARNDTVNIEAYDEYLKGVYYSRRRTKADNETACSHFERALSLDPGFAAAHAALAITSRFMYSLGLDRAPAILERARVHAEKALQLDTQSAEALLIRALFRRDAGELSESIEMLRQAFERMPSSAQVNSYLGNAYRDTGEIAKALEYHRRSMALDPKDFFFAYHVLSDCFALGAKEEFPQLIDRLDLTHPDHYITLIMKGQASAAVGDEETAFRYIEAGIEAEPAHIDSHTVKALYSLYFGRYEDAYRSIRYVIDHSELRPFMLKTCMTVLFSLKRFDETLTVVETTLKSNEATIYRGTDLRALALWYRGSVRRLRGNESDARESFLQARSASLDASSRYPGSPGLRSCHALILASCGEHAEANREIERAVRDESEYNVCWYDKARISALQGDRLGVIRSLRKAIKHAVGEQGAIRNEPTFEAFAEDPEFLALVDPRLISKAPL
jgi:adenylate cyclase